MLIFRARVYGPRDLPPRYSSLVFRLLPDLVEGTFVAIERLGQCLNIRMSKNENAAAWRL